MNNALGLLQGLGQFERYARFTIARAALLLAGIGAATVLQPRQLLPLVSAMIVANAIIAVAIVASLTRRCATPITISRDYLREAFRYGLRGHARILLVHITMRLDQFVLGARLAPEYLGWYSVAVALSEAMLMLPDSVGMVLFPKTAQNPAQAPALGARACRATVAVMVLAAAGVFLIAGWVVPLVYGEAFSPAVTPLRVLVWAVVLQAISRVLRNFFYGVGRPQVSIWSTGAAAVTTLIVLFPLVSRYGLLGAAAASVISHAVAATVDLGWARRISGQALGEFLILRVADVQALPGLRRIFSGGDS
jgi:O-antigen/teichoic acid export membrane protein